MPDHAAELNRIYDRAEAHAADAATHARRQALDEAAGELAAHYAAILAAEDTDYELGARRGLEVAIDIVKALRAKE